MSFKVTENGVCTPGFKAAGAREGKYGVALIRAEKNCTAVAAFTMNKVKSAHIPVTRKRLTNGIQAIVVNSGNANCCVPEGEDDARKMAQTAAEATGVAEENTAVASTGIIGRRIDLYLVGKLTRKAAADLACNSNASLEAAKAIMTTDKTHKMVSVEEDGVHVGAICKGAGMVAPNMGTMLCFMTTNARLPRATLDALLKESVDESFNMVVIDADMSTNDTVLLMSTGEVKCSRKSFKTMLDYVNRELAKMIASDGEGATKMLEVNVAGAKNDGVARMAARAIVSSALVKTAFYGVNPNWGRIASAIGTVTSFDLPKLRIVFESDRREAVVVDKGVSGDLGRARDVLEGDKIIVTINLGAGKGKATAWGCDLTKDYVDINAGYS